MMLHVTIIALECAALAGIPYLVAHGYKKKIARSISSRSRPADLIDQSDIFLGSHGIGIGDCSAIHVCCFPRKIQDEMVSATFNAGSTDGLRWADELKALD